MGQLHIVLIPLMSQGHTIPMIHMAKLFLSIGLRTTVIATPSFAEAITRAQQSGHDIGLRTIRFPPSGSSLPNNIVSLDQLTPELTPVFCAALGMLQEPVEELLRELRPDCLVSDAFLPWTTDSAAKLGVPRLIFHGISCLAMCAEEQVSRHKPYKKVLSDSDTFVLPNLPDELVFTRTQIAQFARGDAINEFTKLKDQMRAAEDTSYGAVINSFYELESAYFDHYLTVLGRKAWFIGPLLLHKRIFEEIQKTSAVNEHKCMEWLDSKPPNTVIYACFGSMSNFTPAQLHDTAVGLEASGQDFIWVVRDNKEGNEPWMPEGYEERIINTGKGLIIQGWAPQVAILNHPAVGAFVTHCGWNSTLEGVCAGIPMVTWPLSAEQFYNEKLVTDVLRTGISVGSKKWQKVGSHGVAAEAVDKAVRGVMVGNTAVEMRSRAKYYKEMATRAVEVGGASYNSLSALIEELKAHGIGKN